MREFKVGPKEVTTLWQGLRFHSARFLKFIALFYVLFAVSWFAGILSRRLYPANAIEPAPSLLPLLVPLSAVVLFGFAFLVFRMAKRDAFDWFQVEETGLLFIRRTGGEEQLLKKVRFDQIRFLILNSGNLFYLKQSRAQISWVGIRYRSDKTIMELDSLVTLGPKVQEDVESILNVLKAKCPNARIFPNQPLE